MNFTRSILTVGGMTILSRVSGFLRDTLSANMLGAGPVADAFFVALRLPNLFRSLFAEGAIAAAFVPLYARVKKEGGLARARAFSGEGISVLTAVLLPFTALIVLFMPQAMTVLAPGFGDRPEVFALAVEYGRITFPYLLLVSVVAMLSGVLNSHDRFAPGAAAPIAFNLIMMAGLLLSPVFHREPGWMMAVAAPISGLVQVLWLWLHCKTLGIAPRVTLPRLTPRVKRLFKQVGPGALGAGATQINLAVSTVLASFLPTGSVSHLFYADRLNQLPLGVIGIAISTTLLPILSARVQAEDIKGVRSATAQALYAGLLLGLPAAIGLCLVAQPIIQVLFEHGRFLRADTVATAAALSAYALGVVPFILVKIESSLFFAHHDTRTPVRFAILAVALNILLALALIFPLKHVGLALATGLAGWANVLMLYFALRRRRLLYLDRSVLPRTLRIVFSAGVMGLFLLLAGGPFGHFILQQTKLVAVPALFGYLAAATLIYGASLRLSGAMTFSEFKNLLRKSESSS